MPKMPRPSRPRVIVTRRLTPGVEQRMVELFDTVLNSADAPMTRADLAAAMADCDGGRPVDHPPSQRERHRVIDKAAHRHRMG